MTCMAGFGAVLTGLAKLHGSDRQLLEPVRAAAGDAAAASVGHHGP